MICNKCGKEIPDNARFCGFCGYNYDVPPDAAADTEKVCSVCGVEIKGKFCVKCGAGADAVPVDVSTDVSTPPANTSAKAKEASPVEKPKAPKSRKKLVLIILGVILVLGVLTGIWGALYVSANGWDSVPFAEKLTFLPFVKLDKETTDTYSDKEDEESDEDADKTDDTKDEETDETDETDETEDTMQSLSDTDDAQVQGAEQSADDVPDIASVTASTTLADQNNTGYSPLNVINSDNSSAWAEGASGSGVGEWLRIGFAGESRLSGLYIKNGYWRSSDRLGENNRIKRIRIDFSDGTREEFNLTDPVSESFSTITETDGELLEFVSPHTTSYIRITITEVYKGDLWDDTCISGISFKNGASVSAAPTEPAPAGTPVASEVPSIRYYILEDSASRYLTTNDLAGLTAEELKLARNEIYARHGRLFTSEDIQDYFNNMPWYNGTISPDDFQEAMLNDYEKKNIELIQGMEALQ